MAQVKTQLVIEGKNSSKKAFDEVGSSLDMLDRRINAAGKAIAGYLSLSAMTGAVRGLARISDGWVEMTDRIRLATRSDQEYEQSMASLRATSDRTFTSMTNNAEVFINSLSVLRQRGFSNNEALQFTETIGLGLVASAAKGEVATQVINQFSNALQLGVLRGDAFNTMISKAPALADALAAGLGKTREELAAMARDGKLTTDVFVPALLSQLDELGGAVDGMNVTVGDALTRLQNAWEEAIGSADVTPFVQAIDDLAKRISDPEVVANIIAIASAMATLAGWTVKVASEFTVFADKAAYTAAQLALGTEDISAQTRELEKLQRTLKEVEAAQTGSSFIGSSTFALLTKWFAPEELDKWAEELRTKILDIEAQIAGVSSEAMKETAERNAKMLEHAAATAEQEQKLRDEHLAKYRAYVGQIRTLRDEQVKAAAEAGKRLVQAEKAAKTELAKVGAERLKIQQRYRDALAGLGGDAEASYGGAQALKIAARDALQRGDIEAAQAQAQAALKMIQDLASAGESTYGFAGFIRELEAIELAANKIEDEAIQNKLTGIRVSMAVLADDAKKLQNMPISFEVDDASMAAAKAAIQQLAAQLGVTLTIPVVTVAAPAAAPSAPEVPGFARGTSSAPPGMAWVGEQGPELVNFRGGEQVLTSSASRNLMARLNGLVVSDGLPAGLVDAAGSASAPAPGRDLGRVELLLGNERYSVLAEQTDFDRIIKRTAMKRGRTRVN